MLKLGRKPPSEKFLILEAHTGRTKGVLLAVDDDRALRLTKQWDNFPTAKFLKHRTKTSRLPWKAGHMNVVVSADPALAATLTLPVAFDHSAKSPITSLDLENIFAQAIGKVFSEYRKAASAHLDTTELHTILVGNRVTHFTVDGREHKLVYDATGKKIKAVLELTFTTRDLFEPWKSFFNAPDDFFFTEAARAELHALGKVTPVPLHLVIAGPERAFAFAAKGGAEVVSLRRGEVGWLPAGFIGTIGAALGVSLGVAREMYGRYLRREISENATRHFDRMLLPHAESLAKELRRQKFAKPLFVDSHMPLPAFMASRVGISEAPLAPLLAKAGFSLNAGEWGMEEPQIFRTLAPFFEFYFDRTDSPLNHRLRRRLHWLGSSN